MNVLGKCHNSKGNPSFNKERRFMLCCFSLSAKKKKKKIKKDHYDMSAGLPTIVMDVQ
jgi:hypothetical protein